MPKIPFDDQILPVDYLLSVQTNIQASKPVSGDDILRMIEQCMRQPLLESARSVVRLALIPAVKTRGRPSKFGASLDLALEKVDQQFSAFRIEVPCWTMRQAARRRLGNPVRQGYIGNPPADVRSAGRSRRAQKTGSMPTSLGADDRENL
jgi:hypothetical protein